jgi:hypothetical protein
MVDVERHVNSHKSTITVHVDVAKALLERAAQLRLPYARLHAILVHNDVEASRGERLQRIESQIPSGKFTRIPLTYQMDVELLRRGRARARALGGTFSSYSESLFLRELRSQERSLTVRPKSGSEKPKL